MRLFNEKKATQVAARFLTHAPDRRLPYMSLIKLMYFADRESLEQSASPITDDLYYSLDNGPILSAVKDLIDEGTTLNSKGFWTRFISAPSDYAVTLINDPGYSELSRSEIDIIDRVFGKYGKLNKWKLRDETHKLAEWKDPDGSAIPIKVEDILEATGLKPAEARQAAAEMRSIRQVQSFLSR